MLPSAAKRSMVPYPQWPASTPEKAGAAGTACDTAALWVKRSPLPVRLLPYRVVTAASTLPEPAGTVARVSLGDGTAASVAGKGPKFTPAGAQKLLPLLWARLPPAARPLPGLLPVTTGA